MAAASFASLSTIIAQPSTFLVQRPAVGCIDWLGLSFRYVDAADDLALAQLPMAINSFDDERLLYVLGTFALLAMIDVNQIGTLNINAVNGM